MEDKGPEKAKKYLGYHKSHNEAPLTKEKPARNNKYNQVMGALPWNSRASREERRDPPLHSVMVVVGLAGRLPERGEEADSWRAKNS